MADISQMTVLNAFYWMKMCKFQLRSHWSLFPRVQLTISQHCFRFGVVAGHTTSHYLNKWWPRLARNICITRPQWVDTLYAAFKKKTYICIICILYHFTTLKWHQLLKYFIVETRIYLSHTVSIMTANAPGCNEPGHQQQWCWLNSPGIIIALQ